ncbi:MAG TPA: ABC transporter substrate-binding protein [Pseudolabrys sp.]|jgi:putative ABC transport system substrate-binding protein|nr:ABC transporter substrate-binding protein [Pseudolabrys sp.]
MRRRDFIKIVAGSTALWPITASAQQNVGPRHIGILLPANASDMKFQIQVQAFEQELKNFGWLIGQNVEIEVRWATADPAEIRRNAAELAALKPDVILAHGSSAVGPMQQATNTIPIVFPVSGDPVAAGFVESLARPGGNITGFALFEYSIGAKWLELLKQMVPRLMQAAVLQQPGLPGALGQFGAIQSAGPTLGVEVKPLNVRDANTIETGVSSFARGQNGGMIVVGGPLPQRHRDLIIALTARNKLPTVYFERSFVTAGGLVSYGANETDQYRRTANYVDRILRGEKPADLPVQAPTKYELVINLKTAKAIGLAVSPALLATADVVLE